MHSTTVEVGATEPIVVSTGKTGQTVTIRICRHSDGFFLDWSDDSFKAVGVVVTLDQALVAKDATNAPGIYQLASVTHPSGLDTSILGLSAAVDDVLVVISTATSPVSRLDPAELRLKCLVDGCLTRKTVLSEVRAKLVGDVALDPPQTPCPTVESTYKDAKGNDLFTHSNTGSTRTTVP